MVEKWQNKQTLRKVDKSYVRRREVLEPQEIFLKRTIYFCEDDSKEDIATMKKQVGGETKDEIVLAWAEHQTYQLLKISVKTWSFLDRLEAGDRTESALSNDVISFSNRGVWVEHCWK